MFTPILGRVSVQNESSSPGAWAQHHPDNTVNTIDTATRHLIFPDVNTNYMQQKFFLSISSMGQSLLGGNETIQYSK